MQTIPDKAKPYIIEINQSSTLPLQLNNKPKEVGT